MIPCRFVTGQDGRARGALPFWLLVLGAFAALTTPRAAQPGMFGDGVIYAAIARNLADGLGSIWAPIYDRPGQAFYEHPPLGFALESLAFRLLGDHLFVERLASIAAGALTMLLIAQLWRQTPGPPRAAWVPIIFWLVPSSVTWAIINNLLDVQQALFTTLAVFAYLRALDTGRVDPGKSSTTTSTREDGRQAAARIAWAALAGAAIAAAVLVKGPTGLFPLAAPVVAAMVFPRRQPALRAGIVMAAAAGAIAVALTLHPAARAALQTYLADQVFASVIGARGQEDRWTSLPHHLVMGVLLRMTALLGLAWFVARLARATGRAPAGSSRVALFFLLMGLAASLPIATSRRIIGHYFVPSIPMFALGFAALAYDRVYPALVRLDASRRARRTAAALGLSLMMTSIALPLAGIVWEPRDVARVAEYRALRSTFPTRTTAGTCEGALADFTRTAYLQRFLRLHLDDGPGRDRHAYFIRPLDLPCAPPPHCVVVNTGPTLETSRCGSPSTDAVPAGTRRTELQLGFDRRRPAPRRG